MWLVQRLESCCPALVTSFRGNISSGRSEQKNRCRNEKGMVKLRKHPWCLSYAATAEKTVLGSGFSVTSSALKWHYSSVQSGMLIEVFYEKDHSIQIHSSADASFFLRISFQWTEDFVLQYTSILWWLTKLSVVTSLQPLQCERISDKGRVHSFQSRAIDDLKIWSESSELSIRITLNKKEFCSRTIVLFWIL